MVLSSLSVMRSCSFRRLGSSHVCAFSTQTPGFGEEMRTKTKIASSTSTTHFGFREIPHEEKENFVGRVFSSVASQYDVMNDVMSGGIHRVWKDVFVSKLRPRRGARYLDVAGGTGDIALRIRSSLAHDGPIPSLASSLSASCFPFAMASTLARTVASLSPLSPFSNVFSSERVANDYFDSPDMSSSSITVLDINPDMLRVGEQRAAMDVQSSVSIDFVHGNAEALPFEDNNFDAYTIAFGIRNVTNIDRALSEAFRVLRPGGRFLCLEFSRVDTPGLREIYDLYSFNMIPLMGQVIAQDADSYRYLVESIRKFPAQEDFASMIRMAGFSDVTHENLTFGVVAIHSGFKL